jgi:hypothetical protein
MKTLTITIVCGADRDTYKSQHHTEIGAWFSAMIHRIMYGKKYEKKGGQIFYDVADTSLTDCIEMFNANQNK